MERIPRKLRERIRGKLSQLAADPASSANNVRAMKGEDVLRLQTIRTPAGEEMVVLLKSEYDALIGSLEDLEDLLIVERSRARIAAGEEELITDAELDDYLDAPTPLAFWRRKRGLTQAALAGQAGVTQAYLSEIEGGKKQARVGVLKKLAAALKVTVDEVVG